MRCVIFLQELYHSYVKALEDVTNAIAHFQEISKLVVKEMPHHSHLMGLVTTTRAALNMSPIEVVKSQPNSKNEEIQPLEEEEKVENVINPCQPSPEEIAFWNRPEVFEKIDQLLEQFKRTKKVLPR